MQIPEGDFRVVRSEIYSRWEGNPPQVVPYILFEKIRIAGGVPLPDNGDLTTIRCRGCSNLFVYNSVVGKIFTTTSGAEVVERRCPANNGGCGTMLIA